MSCLHLPTLKGYWDWRADSYLRKVGMGVVEHVKWLVRTRHGTWHDIQWYATLGGLISISVLSLLKTAMALFRDNVQNYLKSGGVRQQQGAGLSHVKLGVLYVHRRYLPGWGI